LKYVDEYRHPGAIGEIRAEPVRTVLGAASYGGTRFIDMLLGGPLPRIC
jgi:hypothetical protein